MASIEQELVVAENRTSFGRGLIRLVRDITLIALLILLLLELVVRVIWWNQPMITVFDRQLRLLPLPLVTERQTEILTGWGNNPNRYLQFDPVLGWSIRPNARAEGQDGIIYTANSAGIRSLREYPPEPSAGITRIATFGPSFTHGDEVPDDATWQAQMERARPDLEVMNWGVGGYGTDQAFLRYETRGVAYRPDIVIIGFEENNVNEKERVNWPLIKMFVEEVARNNSIPIILVFPERASIEAYEDGQWTFYEAGVAFLRGQGLQVIELPPAFFRDKTAKDLSYSDYYVADGGHFNELGNYIVSQTVLTDLCQQGILASCGQNKQTQVSLEDE